MRGLMQVLEPDYQGVLNARNEIELTATLVSFAARWDFRSCRV